MYFTQNFIKNSPSSFPLPSPMLYVKKSYNTLRIKITSLIEIETQHISDLQKSHNFFQSVAESPSVQLLVLFGIQLFIWMCWYIYLDDTF